MTRRGRKQRVGLRVTTAIIDGKTVATISFRGFWFQRGSLRDGGYVLTIRGNRIHDARGRSLDGAGDGLVGGDSRTEFFRRFGDTDGDGDLDAFDLRRLHRALGSRLGRRR